MDKNNIALVNVKFGDACNFRCRHCVNDNDYPRVQECLEINPALTGFINEEIRLHKEQDGTFIVRLWGGETLLYMEQIAGLIDRLEREGELSSHVLVIVTTNGSLLTQEIVDYFNSKKIHVVLSNDGELTERIRDENVLENPRIVGLLKQLNSLSVNKVFTAYSQDVFKVDSYIKEKLDKDVYISTDFLLSDEHMPEDLYDYDMDAFQETMDKIVEEAVYNYATGTQSGSQCIVGNTANYIIKEALGLIGSQAPCGQMFSGITVDLAGNIYPCMSCGDKIGHLDDIDAAEAEFYRKYNKGREFPDCAGCDYLHLCRGQCFLIASSEGKKRGCEVRKIYFAGVVEYINRIGAISDAKGSRL